MHINRPSNKIFTFLLLCWTCTVFSQNFDTRINFSDTTQVHILQLKTGKKVKGRILKIKNEKVLIALKKTFEEQEFTLSEINRIRVQGDMNWVKKKFETLSSYNTHILFTPTAFNLKEGNNSYRTYFGIIMLYDRAINNNLSLGIGYAFPFFTNANVKFSGNLTPNYRIGFKTTFMIMPFIQLAQENFHIFEHSFSHAFGNPNRFINISFNYYHIRVENYFYSETFFPERYFTVSVGGGWRFDENWQMLFEEKINWGVDFTSFNLLPSLVVSWTRSNHNVSFGFHSKNDKGLDFFPILEPSIDDIATFDSRLFSKIPFFPTLEFFKKKHFLTNLLVRQICQSTKSTKHERFA